MDAVVIEQYIGDLMSKSTAEFPIWNIEKARSGKNLAGIISTAV